MSQQVHEVASLSRIHSHSDIYLTSTYYCGLAHNLITIPLCKGAAVFSPHKCHHLQVHTIVPSQPCPSHNLSHPDLSHSMAPSQRWVLCCVVQQSLPLGPCVTAFPLLCHQWQVCKSCFAGSQPSAITAASSMGACCHLPKQDCHLGWSKPWDVVIHCDCAHIVVTADS